MKLNNIFILRYNLCSILIEYQGGYLWGILAARLQLVKIL